MTTTPVSTTGTVPVLECENVVKELGHGAGLVVALKGVSISLVPGELTLLMGPSGSGKTTLLSILGCIMQPTSGSLKIAGQNVAFWRRDNETIRQAADDIKHFGLGIRQR